MNSRQENRSKLSFTAKIITKYSLERSLSICGEKMSEDLLTHGAPQARFACQSSAISEEQYKDISRLKSAEK